MESLNIIVSHLVGDYLLQTDFMATGKKKSNLICFFHSIWYTIPFSFLCNLSCLQLFLILLQHFLQDRSFFIIWYMKKFGKNTFFEPPYAPWSIFVVDNTFHLLSILLIIKFF